MITYILTETGYQVFIDGNLAVDCPFDPSKTGNTPFDSDAAKVAHVEENYPGVVPA